MNLRSLKNRSARNKVEDLGFLDDLNSLVGKTPPYEFGYRGHRYQAVDRRVNYSPYFYKGNREEKPQITFTGKIFIELNDLGIVED